MCELASSAWGYLIGNFLGLDFTMLITFETTYFYIGVVKQRKAS